MTLEELMDAEMVAEVQMKMHGARDGQCEDCGNMAIVNKTDNGDMDIGCRCPRKLITVHGCERFRVSLGNHTDVFLFTRSVASALRVVWKSKYGRRSINPDSGDRLSLHARYAARLRPEAPVVMIDTRA